MKPSEALKDPRIWVGVAAFRRWERYGGNLHQHHLDVARRQARLVPTWLGFRDSDELWKERLEEVEEYYQVMNELIEEEQEYFSHPEAERNPDEHPLGRRLAMMARELHRLRMEGLVEEDERHRND